MGCMYRFTPVLRIRIDHSPPFRIFSQVLEGHGEIQSFVQFAVEHGLEGPRGEGGCRLGVDIP